MEDHLPTSITQGASNLHSDEDMEGKIKLLDPRVQKLIRTYLEAFGELPPPASCDKLVQMDLKLKPEFVGHKIRRRPHPAPKEQADEIERQIQECIDAGLVLEYKDGDYPLHCSPCFLVAKPGSTAKRLVVDYGELKQENAEPLRVHSQYGVYPGEDSLLSLQDQNGQEERILASGPDAQRSGATGLHHLSGEGVQVEGHAVWRG